MANYNNCSYDKPLILLPLLTEDKKQRLVGCVLFEYYSLLLLQYLATTWKLWRIIQDKRQEV